MDNYFTMPKIIHKLREQGIGIVGTSRFRRNFPPKDLKEVSDEKSNFNDFYWMIDEGKTLLGRWKDNGMVFVTSTIHKVGNIIKRMRKKPRITANNKKHVKQIWGDEGCVEIFIPTLIDDYNHWMGGVDLADQRIAYYHPNMRCMRTWIPMFIQIISMIRNNCFLVYRNHHKDTKRMRLTHKQFTMAMIDSLLKEAVFYLKNPHEEEDSTILSTQTPSPTKRILVTTTITEENEEEEASSRRSSKRRRVILDENTSGTTGLYNASIITDNKQHADLLSPLTLHSSTSVASSFSSKFDSINHKRVKAPRGKNLNRRLNKPCQHCTMLFSEKKRANQNKEVKLNWNKHVKRTEFICSGCNVFLCAEHFVPYHLLTDKK